MCTCYLTIAGYGILGGGRLRVPTPRWNLMVPADWGWGRSNDLLAPFIWTLDLSSHLLQQRRPQHGTIEGPGAMVGNTTGLSMEIEGNDPEVRAVAAQFGCCV